MNKEFGTIEISEGFIVGNYYQMSKKFGDIVETVELKYLGEKEGYKKFLDEDELEVVDFLGGLESCDHSFGKYTILTNKNVLKWSNLSVNYDRQFLTLQVEKDGYKSDTTVSLDYTIKNSLKI